MIENGGVFVCFFFLKEDCFTYFYIMSHKALYNLGRGICHAVTSRLF